MKTIICGCGDVGYSIADKLSNENFEVTVVDEPSEKLNKISDNLDVKVVSGLPSLPSVLLNAGAEDCEILMIWNSISAISCYTGILSVIIYKKNGICVSNFWGLVL